jgi:ankyrin repeat protein
MAALIEAVRRGDAVAVEELLAASPSAAGERDAQGTSAARHAAYARRADLLDLLRPHLGPLDVWEAAALGDDGRLLELLDADPQLAAAEAGDGFAPLALAAFFGHRACVAALLARGADVGQRAANPQQVQPLHAAVVAADVDIVRALLDAGADVNARQQAGVTPLMGAAAGGSLELVRLLLDAGADRSLTDDAGRTAADWAVDRRQPEAAALVAPAS